MTVGGIGFWDPIPASTPPDGGGGALPSIDDPVLFAEVFGPDLGYDQEFDRTAAATLPAGWSWFNQGTATYRERFGAGIVTPPAPASQQHRGIVRPIPVEPAWTLTAKITASGANFNFSWYGLLLTDGTKMVQLRVANDNSGTLSTYNDSAGAGGAGIASNQARDDSPYFRMSKASASSYAFEFSQDGLTWRTVHAGYNVGAFMTPTHVGFVTGATNGPGIVEVACHWLRVR